MKYLYSHQPNLKSEFGLEEANRIQRNVLLAGLCHDLGHGPFSHTFDNLVMKKIWYNSHFSNFKNLDDSKAPRQNGNMRLVLLEF